MKGGSHLRSPNHIRARGIPQIFSPLLILERSILLKRRSFPEGRVFLLLVWNFPDPPVSHGLCLADYYSLNYKQYFTVPQSYIVFAGT